MVTHLPPTSEVGGVNPEPYVGKMVTYLPPTSEVGGSNPEQYLRKMVVYYQWSTVYSTEP